MKRVVLMIAMASAFVLAFGASAEEKTPTQPIVTKPAPPPPPPTNNQTACGAALCLAGVIATGSSPSGCSSYITAYFEQEVISDTGFNPSKTLKQREKFLNTCSSADSNTKNSVNNQYGKSLGL